MIEIVEVAEPAGEEEVLAHIAERALDLAHGFGAIRLAGARGRAVMAQQVDKRRIAVHDAIGRLSNDRSLHAVVQYLGQRAADGLEGGDVAAEHGLQVLAGAEAPSEPATAGQDHGEQADGANAAGFLVEDYLELTEVDLGLLAGRRLETAFEGGSRAAALCVGNLSRRYGSRYSPVRQLFPKASSRQYWIGRDPFAQVVLEGIQPNSRGLDRGSGLAPGIVFEGASVEDRGLTLKTAIEPRDRPAYRADIGL